MARRQVLDIDSDKRASTTKHTGWIIGLVTLVLILLVALRWLPSRSSLGVRNSDDTSLPNATSGGSGPPPTSDNDNALNTSTQAPIKLG